MKHETKFSNDGGTDGLGVYRYTLWRDVRDRTTSRPEGDEMWWLATKEFFGLVL